MGLLKTLGGGCGGGGGGTCPPVPPTLYKCVCVSTTVATYRLCAHNYTNRPMLKLTPQCILMSNYTLSTTGVTKAVVCVILSVG